MTTIISLLLLSTAGVAYAIHELHAHGKLIWTKDKFGFWGTESDKRKYLNTYKPHLAGNAFMGMFSKDWYVNQKKGFEGWYYGTFDIAHTERFPGSATIFVMVTDGPHLMQTVYLMCFSAAIAIHYDRWFISLIIIRSVFGIVFTVVYKLAGR